MSILLNLSVPILCLYLWTFILLVSMFLFRMLVQIVENYVTTDHQIRSLPFRQQ
jgi:hypothetical protein